MSVRIKAPTWDMSEALVVDQILGVRRLLKQCGVLRVLGETRRELRVYLGGVITTVEMRIWGVVVVGGEVVTVVGEEKVIAVREVATPVREAALVVFGGTCKGKATVMERIGGEVAITKHQIQDDFFSPVPP